MSFRFTASLKRRLLSSYNLEAVRSIAWGLNHEKVALDRYAELGAVVEPTGQAVAYCFHRSVSLLNIFEETVQNVH